MSANAIRPAAALVALALFAGGISSAQTRLVPPEEQSKKDLPKLAYPDLPLAFEANQGQSDPSVKFLSRGPGYTLFLTEKEAALSLDPLTKPSSPRSSKSSTATARANIVHLKFAGSRNSASVSGRDPLPGKSNYFLGNDPHQWHTNVPNYQNVAYRDLYPGVDAVFHGNHRRLEYDFIVAPGADPRSIGIEIQGVRRIEINARGDAVLHVDNDQEVTLEKPGVYQEVAGHRRQIAGRFAFRGSHRLGFSLGAYDRSLPLVIDPSIAYSTYLGGTYGDQAVGIAVDSSGSAYVTGQTSSGTNVPSDFPVTASSYPQGQISEGQPCCWKDVFITKFSPNGSFLEYSAVVGSFIASSTNGGGDSTPVSIAVDQRGNAYVVGTTRATDFPTTPGSYSQDAGATSLYSGFLLKLDPYGSSLGYGTFLPGTMSPTQVAVDFLDQAIVVGSALPGITQTTNGAFQTIQVYSPPNPSIRSVGYITQFNASGSSLLLATYLGGTGSPPPGALTSTVINSVAADLVGNVYVTGVTSQPDFPSTIGWQGNSSSCQDGVGQPSSYAFFTEFPLAASFPLYQSSEQLFGAFSTLLGCGWGGSTAGGDVVGLGIALDPGYGPNVYITGSAQPGLLTTSNAFETQSEVYQQCATCNEAFVAKFNPFDGTTSYITYLGPKNQDLGAATTVGSGIAVDSSGTAYVAGTTTSKIFPTTDSSTCVYIGACVFLAAVTPDGSNLTYATYLGGTSQPTENFNLFASANTLSVSNPVAIDYVGGVYTTGSTSASDFPTTPSVYDRSIPAVGKTAAFVTKFSIPLAPPPLVIVQQSFPAGSVGAAYSTTLTTTGGMGTVTWSISSGNLAPGLMLSQNGVLSGAPTQPGTFAFSVKASDTNKDTATQSYSLTINLSIGPGGIPPATVGAVYPLQTFTEIGGIGPIKWSFGGDTPALAVQGMTLAVNNGIPTLSGTPNYLGAIDFSVTATDSMGNVGTQPYFLAVNCQTITVSPGSLPNGTVGMTYGGIVFQYQNIVGYGVDIFANGAIGSVTISQVGLPLGFEIDAPTAFGDETAVLSGVPQTAGTFSITFTATDANQCKGSVTDSLTVAPAAMPQSYQLALTETVHVTDAVAVTGTFITSVGTGVTVQPTDLTTGGTPVTLTFSAVTQAGTTTVMTSPSGPPPQSGFGLGNPPTYYNLSTTATFTPPILVCINYTGISFLTSGPQLFHYQGGMWTNVTISIDTVNDIVCGSVSSLSPFALFRSTTPVITWPTPAAITYGTVLSSTQLNATASVPGSFVYTPAAGALLSASTGQTLSVTFTPTDTADYTTATASVTLAVNKATPAIAWPTPAAIAYGAALSSTQLNATAGVPGSFVYTPAAGTLLSASAGQKLSVTFTPTDTADYTTATASVTLVVNQATPVITWSNPAAINNGTALGASQLNATTNVAGKFVYTPPAGTILQAGTSTLSVTFTPVDTTDYTTATATVSITVNVNGNLTISSGTYTFVNGKITGNLVMTGGTLVLNSSAVDGNLLMSGGSLLLSNNSTVQGNLQITGGGTFSIGPGHISGNLEIQNIPKGAAQNQICGATVNGNVVFQNNGTAVLIGSPSCPGNTISGNVQVTSNSSATEVYGNTISGNVQVTTNSAATQVDDNKVSGNLQIDNNTASTAVFSNTVKANLQCNGNNSSLITGGGNTAAQKQGQCAGF